MIVKTLTLAVMHNGNGRKHQEDACLMPSGILSALNGSKQQNVNNSDSDAQPEIILSETEQNIDTTMERRSGSEDAVQLFAAADGMGGHNIGDLASLVALQTLKDDVNLYMKNIGKRAIDFADLADNVSEDIDRSVRQQLVAWQGMPVGTALSWLMIYNESAYTMSIGHCRIYLFRQNKLYCVTRDHRSAERGSRPDLYYGFRVDESRIVPDNLNRLPLQKGDVLLLTTDGITNVLSDDLIEAVLASPQAFVNQIHKIKDLALEAGSKDNMCVVAVRIQSVEPTENKSTMNSVKDADNPEKMNWTTRFLDRFKN